MARPPISKRLLPMNANLIAASASVPRLPRKQWLRRRAIRLLGHSVSSLCFVVAAQAQTVWITAGAGDFNTAINWSSGVPNSGVDAAISNGTSGTPTIVNLSGAGNTRNLTLAADNTLSVADGAHLSVFGSSIANSGGINVNAGANATYFGIQNDVTLTGTGTVTLSMSGGGAAILRQDAGGHTLTNHSNTIQGVGTIGAGSLALINETAGTINANASGRVLALNSAAATGVTNQGLLEGTGGGILAIQTGVNNTGGQIVANGGTVVISSTISGGTLSSTAGGFLGTATNETAALNSVTIGSGSTYVNGSNSNVNVTGTMTNQGNIQLTAGANQSRMGLSANTTLVGGGQVNLSTTGGSMAIIQQQSGGLTLTNQDNAIQGAGVIGNGGLTVINGVSGTINANLSGQALSLNGTGGVVNQGLLTGTSGGTLNVQSNVDNTGGQITANGGNVLINSTITGGTLSSSGGGVLGTTANQTAVLNGVVLAAGSTYVNGSNSSVLVSGPTVNAGVIQLSAAANNSLLGLNANTTLSGGGQVSLSTVGGGMAIIQQQAGGMTLTNTDNVLQGAGVIGNGGLTLLNAPGGTINANTSGQVLTLNGTGGATNQGLLEASHGGTLNVQTNVNNTGGQIVGGGGTVAFGSTITGGSLTSSDGGLLSTAANQSAAFNGVTFTSGSTYLNGNNTNMYVTGTITNQGTIQLAAAANNSLLALSGDTLLTGGGVVTLSRSGGGGALIQQQVGGLTLTNLDNTIQGAGTIAPNGLTLINRSGGTINANVAGLSLDLAGPGAVTNEGLLEATAGGLLGIAGKVVNNSGGNISGTGGGVVVLSNNATIQGGTLNGTLQNAANQTATLDGSTHGAIALSGGSTYTAVNNSNLFVQGVIANEGQIQLSAGANNALLGLNSSTMLQGGGTVTMSTSGGGTAIIQQQAGGFTFTNHDNTIHGAGTIGNGALTVVNAPAGTINADATGQTLLLNGSGGVTNQGQLWATNGGTLFLQSTTNNAGGQITANGGNVIVNTTISGGTLTSSAGGIFTTATNASAGLNGVTLSAGSTYLNGNNSNLYVSGATTNAGTMQLAAGANSSLMILSGDTTLAGGGRVSLSTSGGGAAYVQQQISGLTLTNQDNTIEGAGFIGNGGLSVVNGPAGTILANTPGRTLYLNGTGGLTNNGTFQTNAGSALVVQSPNLSNFSGNTLSGGTYIVNGAAGNNGTLQMNPLGNNVAGEIVNNAAHITLNGPNANTQFVDAGGNAALKPLAANLAAGSFTVDGGYNFAAVGNLSNAGAVHVGGSGSGLTVGAANTYTQTAGTTQVDTGGTLTVGTGHIAGGTVQLSGGTVNAASFTNDAGALVVGFGALNVRPTNAGTIRAAVETLTLSNGIQGSGATSRVETTPGGTLDVSSGAAGSNAAYLAHDGILQLGTNSFTVEQDYTNVHFGTGNTFDARANVVGSGAINASGNTAQVITGAGVSGGNTAAATLVLGNLREGQSISQTYTVANTGSTGPVLRGAIQTLANGGNLTDTRLSGSGVEAGNFGPIATGGSQAFNVTFDGSSAGALTGQSVAIVNNFSNVADQTLAITGAVYRSAQANTIAPNPVNLGNVHVGDTLGTSFGITNVAGDTGGYTETLGATVTGVSGGVMTSGSVSGLGSGASSNAITAAFDTATAGARSGTATLGFTSTEVGGSGLGTIGVGSQTVTLNGGVYRLAEATLGNVSFGNVLVGTNQTRYLTVSNSALADAFSEGLDASLGSFSGVSAGLLSGSGTLTNLAAGATDTTTLAITLNTSAAGIVTANVQVLLASNGATTSGLGITALPAQWVPIDGEIQINGQVGNLAAASAAVPNPVNLGNVRVGDVSPLQAISLTNVAVGPAEGLNASIGTASPGLVATGSFAGLAAGVTDNSSLVVGMNTSTAGNKSGVANITLQSDGTYNNGTPTSLTSQTVTVNGGVYRLAQGVVAPDPVLLKTREGAIATQVVTASNLAAADGYSEGLRVSAAGSTGAATGSGSTGLIAAGDSGAGLMISLDTTTAGLKSGTATFQFVSDGLGTSGLAPIAAGNATVAASAEVYRAAQANVLPPTINLGTMRTGTVVNTALSVENVAGDTGGYTETLGASFGAVSSGLTGSGTITGLATGAPASNALAVQFTAGAAGAFSGNATVNFYSQEINGSGLGTLGLGPQTVSLTADINALAAFGLTNINGLVFTQTGAHSGLLDFGTLTNPALLSGSFDVFNNVAGPADSLVGLFDFSGLGGSPFSVFGPGGFDLGAGANSSYDVQFDPNAIGYFSGTFVLSLASHNAWQTDLDLGAYTFTVHGRVTGVTPTPDTPPGVVGLLVLLATLALGARASRTRVVLTHAARL